MAVTSAILLGMGLAMLIAGRAMPGGQSPAADSMAGAEALEQIVSELQYSVAINQRSERMIEFTVADRDGDRTPEVIRYEWSGVAGESLTRQYNAGAAATVLSPIRDLALSYNVQTIATQIPQGNESAETLLIEYNSSSYYSDYPIKSDAWYSEYFRPVLPADTIHWKVTRVRFYVEQSGLPGGQTKVQLQTATIGGLPSGLVLEEKDLHEPIWLLYLVQELTYTHVANLSPQQGLCLVFQWQSGLESCRLLGQRGQVTAPNLALAKSIDRSASWSSLPGQSLLFSVYGTVTTAGTPQVRNTYYLNSVEIRLKAGTDDQATVQTSVRTLNRPQVTQ